MITTADHDDCVAPAHSLQLLGSGSHWFSSVLIRIETKAGMALGSLPQTEEIADRCYLAHYA